MGLERDRAETLWTLWYCRCWRKGGAGLPTNFSVRWNAC